MNSATFGKNMPVGKHLHALVLSLFLRIDLLVRYDPTVFQHGCTDFYCFQKCMSIAVAPDPAMYEHCCCSKSFTNASYFQPSIHSDLCVVNSIFTTKRKNHTYLYKSKGNYGRKQQQGQDFKIIQLMFILFPLFLTL